MLTLLTVALLPTAAALALAWWRARQDLTAAHAERRITEAALVRDHAAGTARLHAALHAHQREQAALTAADAILTHALTQHSTQHGSGDPT